MGYHDDREALADEATDLPVSEMSEVSEVSEVSEDSPDGPGDDRGYRVAFDRALRLLGQREHAVRELVDKLTRKGVHRDLAGLVVDDLRGRGLQSDERFAEAFVHSRIGRGHGPIRIRQDLRQRGIDDDLADAMMTHDSDFWRDLASDARCRKFGNAPPIDRGAWNRQARFLAQRGFPADLIYRVLGAED